MKETKVIQVSSKKAPVITFDSETKAVYIKFSNNKVAKTIDDSDGNVIVTIDVDARGNVIGVELVGIKAFTITKTVKILSKRIKDLPDLTNAQLTAC